ncbi:pyruvate, phosphate dikinase [Gordonia westfalica]|uniref:Pyruvate, phosphate dikinase n=3 Tax=Gordonia TaxID=2053 RepID=A0AAW6RAL9_GORRU|nr:MULTISPECIES: pyruvate, phosphate dikinase [Gordonia]MDG6781571.1 pyruvate, phosphate dikinase [Gordonia rubripertincta]MDS1116575.1 pyruvate, phosphate dikinase [Gordonia westfalica]NKY64251.1 pyruvate, phosphate dikinase [Gordonia rubripertincta]SDU79889.1 pyruvate, orthophosphate dikinase [Gordonia westfalica]GAB85417.1 putative pyruvate, phosphate dikinase [Gordonia rubripertincta NBRC 101908]
MNTPAVLALDGTAPADRELLGGKAYSVNRMRSLGLPVPPAFAITTPVCARFHDNGGQLPDEVWDEVVNQLHVLEQQTGKTFGAGPFPLLVSVRSGAAQSMPGMMDTVLNLGLTEQLTAELAEATGDHDWARDTWARFCAGYGEIVLGDATSAPPADPHDQLREAIGAVFRSWTNERVTAYRRHHGLGEGGGTAVTVQAMVFGNRDEQSGTGVIFSRDPATGDPQLFGEWLSQAQGEDVVSGERTPQTIDQFQVHSPQLHQDLSAISATLEAEHRDLVDIEFTVESGTLYMLQCRSGKRSARAAVRIAVDLAREGLISREEAVSRISAEQAETLAQHNSADACAELLASGTGAGPGAAVGVVYTDTDAACIAAAEGERVVLVRPSTSPADVPAMFDSVAVVTEVGGTTSHAALVCREIGVPCVVGCGIGLSQTLAGQTVTVDGTTGKVYAGDALNSGDTSDEYLDELLSFLPDTLPDDHPLKALQAARSLEAATR